MFPNSLQNCNFHKQCIRYVFTFTLIYKYNNERELYSVFILKVIQYY